jgi:hypothetical protein
LIVELAFLRQEVYDNADGNDENQPFIEPILIRKAFVCLETVHDSIILPAKYEKIGNLN